jgi:hypothetical protein
MAASDRRAGFLLAALLAVAAAAGLSRPAAAAAAAEYGFPSTETITFRTVPPIAGVRVQSAGRTALTDAQGLVTLTVPRTGRAFRAIEPPRVLRTRLPSGREVRFGGLFDSGRTLGLSIYGRVRLRFVDLQGDRVPAEDVARVRLRSSTGLAVTMRGALTPALQATRVGLTPRGVRSKPLRYAVESVKVGGGDVVHRGERRFFPAHTSRVRVPLLLYSARFTATDALTGRPAGTAVLLEYPNGRIVRMPLRDGVARAAGLPRGAYRVRVVASGLSPEQPVALSRDQDVELRVVSHLDLAVVSGAVLALALGLMLTGRRLVRRVAGHPTWRVRTDGSVSVAEDQDARGRARPLRAARSARSGDEPGGDGGRVP